MPVQLVFGLRFAATSSLAHHPASRALVGLLAWLAITAAIYLVNGLSDIDGDRANGSPRPLATGKLSRASARRAAAVLGAIGLLVAATVSSAFFVLAVVMLGLGLAYSYGPAWKTRSVSAGLTIGTGAGLTYAAGWYAVSGATPVDLSLAVGLAVWTAASSATKDFSDVAGDTLAGRRTLPVTLGTRRAAIVVAAATLMATAGVLALATIERTYVVPVVVLAVGSVRIPLGFNSTSAGETSNARRPYRAYMSTQYAATCAMIAIGA